MKFIAIIPARYASTRFPGKPLALLGGIPIIQHVYERVSKIIPDTFVATDDERIGHTVDSFGGKYVMTSVHHHSGTDRCEEAVSKTGVSADIVINVQGDEPFITADQIKTLCQCFDDSNTDIATLVKPFTPDMGYEVLKNPNSPKVVIDENNRALYFSRSIIPYLRGIDESDWLLHHTFYKHIGLYAYRRSVLSEITQLSPGILEQAESLEQLRWLENGYCIRVGKTDVETIGIDTPEDLQHAADFLIRQAQKNY